ncbi:hypothetical protein [Paraglaciecola sp. L3A3]|uniref:hypothetical protein n=1 Tax=Paraglaciecola sp. L3A3 TaxID=2686358 RepID=UPI00131E2B20|nr:hypothetical protein [Paraglaciecola sp. L3A3]
MKTLIILTFLLLTTSALVIAQTEQSSSDKAMPLNLNKLQQALANADQSKQDRNSKLRLERANFYYQQAQEYYRAGWDVKAKDYIQRGILLVELHQRTSTPNKFYRPQAAAAQQASLTQTNDR